MSTQDLHELMAQKGFQKKSISALSDTGNSTVTKIESLVDKESAKLKSKVSEHGRMKKEMTMAKEIEMIKEKERNIESSQGNVAVTVMGTQELTLKLKDHDNTRNKTETTTTMIATKEVSIKEASVSDSTDESY